MKKSIYIIIAIFGVFLIGLFGYVYSKYKVVEKGVNDMQITFDDSTKMKTLTKMNLFYFY